MMPSLTVVVVLSVCACARALREEGSEVAVLDGGESQAESTFLSSATCDEFAAEVKRLNLSVPASIGMDVLCEQWPKAWGPFPDMSTTKAIEDFVKDAGDYYKKFKQLNNSKSTHSFCWTHLGYATRVHEARKSVCPGAFHPKDLGDAEVTAHRTIKPDWAGFCTKHCDEMCGAGGTSKLGLWCKCPVNGSHVTVSKSVRRESVTCPSSATGRIQKWGSGCFAQCPVGTTQLAGSHLPFCKTECAAHEDFNVSCGWGCARSARDCADSTEKMIVYGLTAALDVVAIATGAVPAIPMIYTLAGLVDGLYSLIERLVLGVQDERKKVKELPFLAALTKFANDTFVNRKGLEDGEKEAKSYMKDIVQIGTALYTIAKGLSGEVNPVSVLAELFGKFHLSVFVGVYDTFKAFHHPLCPYSTGAVKVATENYDGSSH